MSKDIHRWIIRMNEFKQEYYIQGQYFKNLLYVSWKTSFLTGNPELWTKQNKNTTT